MSLTLLGVGGPPAGDAGEPFTIENFPTTNDDDMWSGERGGTTFRAGSTSDLAVGDFDGTEYDAFTAILFRSVLIPQGATITTATVSVVPHAFSTAIPTIKVQGVAADTFATVPTTNGQATAHSLTTAAVNWLPGAWVGGNRQISGNIASVVEEIVGRAGWASGNNLVISLEHASGYGGSQAWARIRTTAWPNAAYTGQLSVSGTG